MPEAEYSPLKELILDSNLDVVRTLSEVCHSERMPLATSLLRIFRFEKKEADLCGKGRRNLHTLSGGEPHHLPHGPIHEKRLHRFSTYGHIPHHSS
ncbi:Ras GTPaseactivating protein 1like, partial [Caligus rogercresseyi]